MKKKFIGSNRIPDYPVKEVEQLPKDMELKQLDDGNATFVEAINPFKGLKASSYSLSSQLKNGTALHQMKPRSLEGANGSDYLEDQITKVKNSKSE